MLSNKTQEALKVFLEGVKNETGMEVTDVKLFQHKQKEPSQKQMEQMKNVGFKDDDHVNSHWLSNSKVMVDDVDIDFTCFYTPKEIPDPLQYCTAEGCLNEPEPDPDNEDGLCSDHMEDQAKEWEAEQKHQDYEYKQSKI